MKKLLVCLMLLLSLLTCAYAEEAVEGFRTENWRCAVQQDGTVELLRYLGDETDLILPEELNGYRVTALSDMAFMYGDSVTRVTIPASVTEVNGNPFIFSHELTEIVLPADHPTLTLADGVLFHKEDARLIWYPSTSAETEYAVPEGTKAIGENAFSYGNPLQRITLPASLQTIGEQAFNGCCDLQAIVIPEGVTRIGSMAFAYCYALTDAQLPASATFLGENPFRGCTALTNLTVAPDNPAYEAVGGMLISGADGVLIGAAIGGITDAVVPEGVTAIGDGAFYESPMLRSVTLPGSVRSIGMEAFSECPQLAEVNLAEGLQVIGELAFAVNPCLTEMVIPEGVTEIGGYAFCICKALKRVVLPASLAEIGYEAFLASDQLTLTVPRDSYAASWARQNSIPFVYPGE